MKKIKSILAVIFAVACAFCLFSFTSSAAEEGKWIKAWSTAATQVGVKGYDNISAIGQEVVLRTVVTPTASGSEVKIKFSNAYGKKPLVIKRAKIALSDKSQTDSGIHTSTLMPVTFSGDDEVTIPVGQELYCDAIPFDVVAGEDIAVSTYIKEFTEFRTMGLTGGRTYFKLVTSESSGLDLIESPNLNIVYDIELDDDTKWLHSFLDMFAGWILGTGSLDVSVPVVPFVTDIEVLNPNENAYSVVVIGDSTVANEYPKFIAEKIRADYNITDIGISAKGLIGNRLLGDGLGYGSLIYGEGILDRMKKDIIGLDGKNSANVKYVILKTGANDIIHPVCSNISGIKQPTANEIFDGYKKVYNFCHENGIKLIVIGITPWGSYKGDATGFGPDYRDRNAQERSNDWAIADSVNIMLEKSSFHDGYINYMPISGGKDSTVLDSTPDGLNPSQQLQREWADNFPLGLIGVGDVTRAAGVGIPETSLTLYRGTNKKLTAKVTPASANQAVTWKSSNTAVAEVKADGTVVPKAKGQAVITATTVDKGYSGKGYSVSCTVTVKVKPENLQISGTQQTVYTGKSVTLKLSFTPSDTDFKTVKWSSSNEKVATVDSKGIVKGTGKGTAVITAVSTFDGKIKATYTVTVKKKVQVQSIYLNYYERTRNVGTSFTLVPTVNPSKATFPEVTWKSSDKKIAKVDKNGKVKALRPGTVIITCKSVDNPGVSAACIVTVKIKTEGVELPTKKLTLYTSQTKTLKAEIIPENATNKKVTWSSSNKSVATVSKSGKITAKKPGTTTITVKTKSGGYKATCKVTVKKYVKLRSFKLNKTSVSVNDGKTYTLKPVFSPSNASNKDLVWKSSNTKIATVSSKGVVKGIKPGTCTVSCRSKETGKTVTCTVKVKKVKVKKILFAEKVYTVKHNKSLQLKAHISPVNATNQKIKWTSSHPEVVKVSSKGKVTGLKL
ncbi:MAG: Ig-like domain-containing protein, partial [Clostridia bacterium]|nr:Ig-like domain-containing protein [Clostridia bacterium]